MSTKTKKIQLLTMLIAGVLVLTGCGSQAKSNTSSNKATASSTNAKKVDGSSSTKNNTNLWTSTKDKQLANFINQWAPTMGQSYTKYDGTNSLKTSTGTVYPDDLTKVTVDGAKTSIGWSKTGKSNYTYNVVAIYNYDGTEPPLPNHITYFFSLRQGKPVVLVDQSRDGTPDLTETDNTAVKSNFVKIVQGTSKLSTAEHNTQTTSDSTAASSSSSSSNTDTSNSMISENKVPWKSASAHAFFDSCWKQYSDQETIVGFKKYDDQSYSLYVKGDSDPFVTVDISTGNFHG